MTELDSTYKQIIEIQSAFELVELNATILTKFAYPDSQNISQQEIDNHYLNLKTQLVLSKIGQDLEETIEELRYKINKLSSELREEYLENARNNNQIIKLNKLFDE